MMKATVQEVRLAFAALNRLFDGIKLPRQPAWRVTRLINQLRPTVKEYEQTQLKLFVDAGGQQTGSGVVLDGLERLKDETDETWLKRRDAHREKVNGLYDELRALDKEVVEINYDPIPLSMLPIKRKNEKGEEVDVDYNAKDLAECGPFVEDKEATS